MRAGLSSGISPLRGKVWPKENTLTYIHLTPKLGFLLKKTASNINYNWEKFTMPSTNNIILLCPTNVFEYMDFEWNINNVCSRYDCKLCMHVHVVYTIRSNKVRI